MATRSDARTETREEFEARLLRQSDAADAGEYDHIFQRATDYLISQLPDGYILKDGHIVRTDPNLPAPTEAPKLAGRVDLPIRGWLSIGAKSDI